MKRILIALFMMSLVASCATSAPVSTQEEVVECYEGHPADVDRVVDGDTIDLMVELGYGMYTKQRVRLARVDTPEVYGVKHSSEEYQPGLEASKFTKEWLSKANGRVIVQIVDGKGKYGRWIAEIYSPYGESLNDALVERWPSDY